MKDMDCTVRKLEKISHDMYSLTLNSVNFKTLPGQFAMLKVPGHTLRRPLAIVSMGKNVLQFAFKVIGSGTKDLTMLKPGDAVKVLAPLGKAFPIIKSKKRPVLIGGGTGSICIYALAKFLKAGGKRPYIIIGAKSERDLPLKKEFSALGKLLISTDDGSCGEKCTTAFIFSQLIKSEKDIIVYSCGPLGMLKAVHDIVSPLQIESYCSVEEKMACGVGACVGCVVKTPNGLKRVCKDGPVFSSYELFGMEKQR
jgi:dihydroorotate dehydrogenase electron transfer subunit